MTAQRQRTASYAIIKVRKTEKPNQYIVTVTRDGRAMGDVRVVSTSSDSAYYNDPEPPRKGFRKKLLEMVGADSD